MSRSRSHVSLKGGAGPGSHAKASRGEIMSNIWILLSAIGLSRHLIGVNSALFGRRSQTWRWYARMSCAEDGRDMEQPLALSSSRLRCQVTVFQKPLLGCVLGA
jgi:hypothetical protein